VSGNVPYRERDSAYNDRAPSRYFKIFYSPTVTAIGLGLGTVLLDFLINATALIVNGNGIK
jgi:hypothetical protein